MRHNLIAIAAAILITGCATSGNRFDIEQAAAVTPGTPLASVVATMGKPTTTVTTGQGNRIAAWTYTHANAASGKSEVRSIAMLFDAGDRFVRVLSTTDTGTQMR